MTEILLIIPPSPEERFCVRDKGAMGYSKAGYIFPPYDMISIAAFLREKGFDLKLIDANANKLNLRTVEKVIKENKPKFVIFSNSTPTIHFDLNIAKICKKLNKKIVTVTFGPHIVSLGKEVLKSCLELDYGIVNEYELTILDILKRKSDKKIKGIFYRIRKEIIDNGKRESLENLDTLPFPAHDLLNLKLYQFPYSARKPVAATMTTRGCPNKCIFCQTVLTWKKFKARSCKHVMDEIKFLCNKLKVKEIKFWDDNFTYDEKRVIDLCDEILKEKLKFGWIVNARVDKISEKMLRKMKKAGCHTICFGVESGDEEVLKSVGKELTLSQIRSGFKLAKKVGLKTLGFFMIGHPKDTKKTINKTINFAKELNPDMASFNIVVPFPGTPLFTIARHKNWIKTFDWSKYESTSYPVYTPPNLTRKEIYALFKKSYREFYFRPSFVLNRLINLKNFDALKKDLKSMFGLIKILIG
jgi:radical SAM superfamily enzyme YgiQ (UPF0313 family)